MIHIGLETTFLKTRITHILLSDFFNYFTVLFEGKALLNREQ